MATNADPIAAPGLSKDDTLTYIPLCRQKIYDSLAAETEESLAGPSGFFWYKITRGEMHLVNIRHIQHHTGQLSAYLRRVDEQFKDRKTLRWIGSGWRLESRYARHALKLTDRLPHFRQPLVGRNPIRPEFLERAEIFARQQAAVLAQFRRGRVVEEAGRVGRAHLERDPHFELAQRHAIEHAADVVVRVAPQERVNAPGRTVAQNLGPLLVGAGRLVAVR